MRFLGVDYGSSKIGIAISDDTKIIASPMTTISNEGPAKFREYLNKVLIKYGGLEAVIVGKPISKSGDAVKIVEAFFNELNYDGQFRIIYFDERFTSRMAQSQMKQAGMKGSQIRNNEDSVAAQIMLQGFLDS